MERVSGPPIYSYLQLFYYTTIVPERIIIRGDSDGVEFISKTEVSWLSIMTDRLSSNFSAQHSSTSTVGYIAHRLQTLRIHYTHTRPRRAPHSDCHSFCPKPACRGSSPSPGNLHLQGGQARRLPGRSHLRGGAQSVASPVTGLMCPLHVVAVPSRGVLSAGVTDSFF